MKEGPEADWLLMGLSVPLFAETVMGLELDDIQRELLASDSKKVLLNCARQWGKSTMAAVKCVHRALYWPESLALILSPSSRQSAELVMKARRMCWRVGERVKGDGENPASIVLANGSRIVGLPARERTTRGFSNASLVIVDEASRVDDEEYYSMMATLSRGLGDLWLMSTPHGPTGFFWKEWSEGDGWLKVRATAEECPRTSREFLAAQRKGMTEDFYKQEYECDFLSGEDSFVKLENVHGNFSERWSDLGLRLRF